GPVLHDARYPSMKFHWFSQVGYPYLAPDFPQAHDSTWVDVPPSVADSRKIGHSYHMFLRLLQHAERAGFDGLAGNEHHQTPFAMTPSPNLMAAALATMTKRAAPLLIG